MGNGTVVGMIAWKHLLQGTDAKDPVVRRDARSVNSQRDVGRYLWTRNQKGGKRNIVLPNTIQLLRMETPHANEPAHENTHPFLPFPVKEELRVTNTLKEVVEIHLRHA